MRTSTQVLLAGCGLTGSSTAVFLRRHGVDTLAVERRTTDFPWPRTRMLLGRSMEIFRDAALEEPIRSRASMFGEYPEMARAQTVDGPEWMRGELEGLDEAERYSPTPWAPIDQHRLEPLLREQAAERGATIEYGARLTGFEQDASGVTATVRDAADGSTRTVRADYLIATDGADSVVRDRLGIRMRGAGLIGHYVNIVWEADISAAMRERPVGIWFLDRPRPGAVIMPQDVRHRWILMVPHDPATGETLADFTGERCVQLVRDAVGVPDLPVRLVALDEDPASPVAALWEVQSCVAETFRVGRTFLVGDSAHLMPPVGAFGANLGIQDGHNLAWKLALVLDGRAGESLLDSYEQERVPVAEATVHAATSHLQVRSEAGGGGDTTGGNLAVIFGQRYTSTAVLPDDGPADPGATLLHPSELYGMAGTRAPHLTLSRGGEPVSSLDLYGGEFVLLAGADGQAWTAAVRRVAAELDLPVRAHRLGDDVGDPTGCWERLHRSEPGGALLVRPDGFVAWRADGPSPTPDDDLRRALRHVLDLG